MGRDERTRRERRHARTINRESAVQLLGTEDEEESVREVD